MRHLWRSVLDEVAPYDAVKPIEAMARELGIDAVLRLSANESPLGPSPRTKAIMICTPHNPASTLVPRRQLEAFLASLGSEPPLVVVDEAYIDFCDDPDAADGVDLVRHYPTVVALRTFSKIAGLAGLRVGYAMARPESIERLNRVRAPYNVNRLAQVAAVAALDDRAHLARTRAL